MVSYRFRDKRMRLKTRSYGILFASISTSSLWLNEDGLPVAERITV